MAEDTSPLFHCRPGENHPLSIPVQAIGLMVFTDSQINPKLAVTQEFLFAKLPSPPSLAEDIGGA